MNGQPSVIYGADISENQVEEVKLTFKGSGSVEGSDGEIHTETEGLTTATSIVKITTVTFPK